MLARVDQEIVMKAYRRFLCAVLAMASVSAYAMNREGAQVELAQATTSVQAAERDDAVRYAPADLDEAHAMLGNAQRAADARAWTNVAIFSERAKVTGDLASARSRQQRAETATIELQRSLDALHAQTTRGGAP
jgi:chromosome segregation ATPase